MAVSLLRDWCRGLDVDTHRALLVTGIPEGLERAAIEAVLQPALLPLGTFRLWNTRAARDHKAKAALVEFVQDINHASVPREIPGKDGVWRVVCQDPAEDPGVLRHMRRLMLDDRPLKATGPWAPENTLRSPAKETQVQASEPTAKRAGPPPRRGRRARRNRARGNRWVPRGQSTEGQEQPPTSARPSSFGRASPASRCPTRPPQRREGPRVGSGSRGGRPWGEEPWKLSGAARRDRADPGTRAGAALSPAASPAPARCPRTVAAQTLAAPRPTDRMNYARRENRGPDAAGAEGAGRLLLPGGGKAPPSPAQSPRPQAGPPEPRGRRSPEDTEPSARGPGGGRRQRPGKGRTDSAGRGDTEPVPVLGAGVAARGTPTHAVPRGAPWGGGTEETILGQGARWHDPGRLRGEPSARQVCQPRAFREGSR
ncbi:paraneoplastic antigen-like protein 8A [Lontra canadensis]|uniref:paraneoplastic antigen-like protein 8A n=1 Tax=Lontra canadensis TaxID=76717 RepID=UPI0013F2C0EA|nr:paraneoplastic antigen-like protein 8A [Lontra canadensis]